MTKPRTEGGVIVRVISDATAEYSGLESTPFYIHLHTDLLRAGDKLIPTDDFDYRKTLIVQSRPECFGRGYLYKVCHMDTRPKYFYPKELISKGCKFEYVGASVPDLKPWEMWIMDYVKFN